MANFNFKNEIIQLWEIIKSLNKTVLTVLLLIPILQTISYYYITPKFFLTIIPIEYLELHFIDLFAYYYWFICDFLLLFFIPVLVNKYFIKLPLRKFGLKFGDYKFGMFCVFISLPVIIVIVWFSSSSEQFVFQYPYLQSTKDNWNIFLLFEMGLLFYLFAWEFIWRGFMLFGLEEKFGYYAILIQMIPFVMLHNGKPSIETFSAILGGLLLGIIAFRSRSFFYGILIHFSILFSIDYVSILRYRYEDYGIGISSLMHIIGNLF